ncbi:uncharacterized protein [Nicotiana sylvestris]|uniref:uncharacterized protein n=1 Tax=Nicotiana sylvestris TaxID=4096 RepID=UPI00388C3BAA
MAAVETTESGKICGKNKKRKEKESEGAQGAVREMGKGVAESSPTLVGLTEETGAMVVWDEESAGEEESVREKGGSSSGEATEGYNPKKKKSLGVKVPGTARANKKRKVSSSIPIDTPPTRGRSTRKESKRKATGKGKKKLVEPIEAVEIEEMDLVLRDEKDAEEMKVVTPKAKKIKTSKKKSASKTKSAEPSPLAKKPGLP